MDSDLQDPPELIENLSNAIRGVFRRRLCRRDRTKAGLHLQARPPSHARFFYWLMKSRLVYHTHLSLHEN